MTLCLRTNLVICQSSRSCTYTCTPFLPQGSKLSLFSLYEQQFPRYVPFFKIDIQLYLGMKLGKWPKFQKSHIYPLSTPGGANLSLFLLYAQRFPRYGPICKIAIFGHETWPLAKCHKLHIYLLSTPSGQN